MPPHSLSSQSSSSNASTYSTSTPMSRSRRTRKRFSPEQLIALEQTFHKTSHPTREERDALAKRAKMDAKSVTIWFQNKRQTERKVALHNATNRANTSDASSSFHTSHIAITEPDVHQNDLLGSSTSRTSHRSLRPTLDRVASRSELPTYTSRTHSKHKPRSLAPNHEAPWENMPSSPVHSDASPPPSPRDRFEFDFIKSQSKKTLEWACAAARLTERTASDQDQYQAMHDCEAVGGAGSDESDDDTETGSDNGAHDIMTPNSSQSSVDYQWISDAVYPGTREQQKIEVPEVSVEEDVMYAAWALCGLSRQ